MRCVASDGARRRESRAPFPSGPAPGCPPDPRPHTLDLVTRLAFPEAGVGGLRRSSAEPRPRTPDEDSERGLMYRTRTDDGRGMLFSTRASARRAARSGCGKTCIPLDMIFLDDDGFVVGILENVPTLNEVLRARSFRARRRTSSKERGWRAPRRRAGQRGSAGGESATARSLPGKTRKRIELEECP